ncbi:D-tyrosyl-tRNA(Tyr) deacylase [Dissulfurirhabdus thermomarina]|uniref:D-aminoacyl-tRNA deacylase n=1 Tax=Dissulfurirhabdus thermomarina TaxID=1765737 RepID=A0A6N9TVE5_DISTH|nr:D-aminoacyl-tRNA deacylase [Dissulfurirhabdus thermomarina]NDY42466.1 D-tyrosyl-tRNA(Tyr) deacylase [Dissulfurirhabdus thermomarina]NMX23854.1 D-tyrosyl-tRNA(Tyr) deacylase [Dissulfurirhabdus thermomarina]
MRAVWQRVSEAGVKVDGEEVARIGRGALVLLGVERGDGEADARYLAEKIVSLRAFEDAEGRMNRSVADIGGGLLLVSQFTLAGDCRKGRRPSFAGAAPPEEAERLYLRVAELARGFGVPVATGRFRARMAVRLVNDGPVTLLLDSRRRF